MTTHCDDNTITSIAATTTTTSTISLSLLLIGDSDIERWPDNLQPFFCNEKNETPYQYNYSCTKYGYNGITLSKLGPKVNTALVEAVAATKQQQQTNGNQYNFYIICAGENDISYNIPQHQTIDALQKILDNIFSKERKYSATDKQQPQQYQQQQTQFCYTNNINISTYVLFLGPKLEPWLTNDVTARKQYIQMSMLLEHCCTNHKNSNYIIFINCLTLFCCNPIITTSTTQPGAISKAIPDKLFFNNDELHLSNYGYQLWKELIESCIHNTLLIQ